MGNVENRCKQLDCTACCRGMCLTMPHEVKGGRKAIVPLNKSEYLAISEGARVLEIELSNFFGVILAAARYAADYDLIVSYVEVEGEPGYLVKQTDNCPQLIMGECGIYSKRPFPCQDFPADRDIGGPTCDTIRVAHGLPPFARTGK